LPIDRTDERGDRQKLLHCRQFLLLVIDYVLFYHSFFIIASEKTGKIDRYMKINKKSRAALAARTFF